MKKACIFIGFHLDVELQQDVYQIGVGIIEHIKVTQYTRKLLLKFCPLKVRSQQRVFEILNPRADICYKDITCNITFKPTFTTKKKSEN